MWRLCLTPDQAGQIISHALSERPREACGLIAGAGDRAEQVVALANVAENPTHEYRVADRDLVENIIAFQRAGWSLVGIYHSHPTSDPIPSQTDIRQAAYPECAHLIVGLKNGEPRLTAWAIRCFEVVPLDIRIGPYVPEDDPDMLSRAQKTAIIVAGIASVLLLLFMALSLLPPAPIIIQTPIP